MADLLVQRKETQKNHWWLSNRKIVGKYIKEARNLISRREHSEVMAALNLLDAALALSPRLESALELKARCLLYLRRFNDVADMLRDDIPSIKMAAADESGSVCSDNLSQPLSREVVNLLNFNLSGRDLGMRCFSGLKDRVAFRMWRSCEREGQWRYLVLGLACCHLGLMEDALILLQTGKRLSTAAFRRKSISWTEDSFSFSNNPISGDKTAGVFSPSQSSTELDNITYHLSSIKLLLRRRAAAVAALNAGLYSESIRHFSKIVDGRRGVPQGFLVECYMHRAIAQKSSNKIAEAIADCNRTLALDPACIQALEIRASLLESILSLPDCLHDLEHLKLLYNSILRDRKLPGPCWKQHSTKFQEIPQKLSALTVKIQELKRRVASGETAGNVDYYTLIGLRQGCSRSELERAHLLLCLKHKPDKAMIFIERCDFSEIEIIDSARDRAKISSLSLYRLLQKGYSSVMSTILEE